MADELIEIVQRAKANNGAALAALVAHYQTPACRVAQNILGTPDDAEDAVQDAWLLALRKLHTLHDPARFGGWFYRIVANVALRKRQKRTAQGTSLEALELLVASTGEQLLANEYGDLLPVVMHALSSKEQIVVTLHYFGSVPVAQLAALLDLPSGTIKSRLHHARQVLRKELLNMSTQPNNRPDHIPTDFRQTIAGMKGKIEWQAIFDGDFAGWFVEKQPITPGTVPNHWTVVGNNGVMGELWQGGARLLYGDPQWRNVEFSLLVTPLAGGNAQILFRVDGQGRGFYLCDLLMGWQAVAVSRVDIDQQGQATLVKLSVVNYPLAHQREYALTIAARDHSITTYIDGALVNQVTNSAWLQGQIGLNIWEAKTLFRDIRMRVLE